MFCRRTSKAHVAAMAHQPPALQSVVRQDVGVEGEAGLAPGEHRIHRSEGRPRSTNHR